MTTDRGLERLKAAGYPQLPRGAITQAEGLFIREQIEAGRGLQPDRPGGQVVTLPEGSQIYLPQTTMYEMGFRTPAEYKRAQTRGVAFGVHSGERVPEDSVLLTDKKGNPIYRLTRSQFQQQITQDDTPTASLVQQGYYKMPVKNWRGDVVYLSAKQLQERERLSGSALLEYDSKIGLMPPPALTRKQVERVREFERTHTQLPDKQWMANDVISQIKEETPELHRILITEGYRSYLKAVRGVAERAEYEEKDFRERHTQLPDGTWIGNVDLTRIEKEDSELHKALTNKGWEAAEKVYEQRELAYDYLIADYDAKLKVFESDLKEQAPELYTVYQEHGVEGYNKLITEYEKDKPDAKVISQYLSADARKAYEEANPGDKFAILQSYKLMPSDTFYTGKSKDGEPLVARGADIERFLTSPAPLIMAAEILVPGVYLARNWGALSPAEKGIYIAMDALSPLFILGAGVRGGRAGAAFGRTATTRAARQAVQKEMVAQLRAPIDVVIHPIGTAKATAKEVRNLVENIARPKKLPYVTITTSEFLPGIRITEDMTEAQARAAVDILMEQAIKGERIYVNTGNYIIEMPRSALMQEIGGGLAHVSSDVRRLEKGGTVTWKEGLPSNEQGWFLSPEPATQFVKGSAFGVEQIPVPPTAKEKVWQVAKFRADDLVRLDKTPVRAINFADAENIPTRLAKPLQDYIEKNRGRVYGSFNEWVKIKGAKRPADLDVAFRNQGKAMDDILKIVKRYGFKARKAPHAIEIFDANKNAWVQIIDVADFTSHNEMIPRGLAQAGNKVEGIIFEKLGEQYLRQSYGAVAETAKAEERARRLNKAAKDVRKLLKESGVGEKKPGILIISQETAIKSVPTKKVFKDIVETERKLVVGADIPEPKQWLFTRIGATGDRVEIGLEIPLKAGQIAKLKAKGLVETIKAPFTPAIRVRPVMKTGLDSSEVVALSKVLKESGYLAQADDLMRVERYIAATRRKSAPLTTITGRVMDRAIETARERITRQESIDRDRYAIFPEEPTDIVIWQRSLQPRRVSLERGTVRLRLEDVERHRVPVVERPVIRLRPEVPERPHPPERLEVPERPTPPERPRVPERPRIPVRAEMPERPISPERPDLPERPTPPERPRPPERPTPPRHPEPPRPPKTPVRPILLTRVGIGEKQAVPSGSLAWSQGARMEGETLVPQWYYIPPPWKQPKPISLNTPPIGAKNTDSQSPYDTIQIIGRSPVEVPSRVEVDLGIMDIFIINGRDIQFKSGGEETDVGSRLPSPTVGMDLTAGGGRVVRRKTVKKVKKTPKKRRRWDDFSEVTSLRGIRW